MSPHPNFPGAHHRLTKKSNRFIRYAQLIDNIRVYNDHRTNVRGPKRLVKIQLSRRRIGGGGNDVSKRSDRRDESWGKEPTNEMTAWITTVFQSLCGGFANVAPTEFKSKLRLVGNPDWKTPNRAGQAATLCVQSFPQVPPPLQ